MVTLGQVWVAWIAACVAFAAVFLLRLTFFDPRSDWRWMVWFFTPGLGALAGGTLGGVQLAATPSATLAATHPLYGPLAVIVLLFASVALAREVWVLPAYRWSQRLARAQRTQQYAAALAACDRLLGLPGVAPAYVWTHKAVALLGLDRYSEGLAACDQALALAPQPATWTVKAFVAAHGRHHDAAQTAYERTRTLSAYHTPIEWARLSYVAQVLGRPEEALAACAQAVAQPHRTPTNALVTALASRAAALNDLGRYQEALAAAEQALARVSATAPFPVRSQVARAVALAHLREPAAARAAAEQAFAGVESLLTQRPGSLEAQEGRGILLRLLGRSEEVQQVQEMQEMRGGAASVAAATPPSED